MRKHSEGIKKMPIAAQRKPRQAESVRKMGIRLLAPDKQTVFFLDLIVTESLRYAKSKFFFSGNFAVPKVR
jgi:hypothetical protein